MRRVPMQPPFVRIVKTCQLGQVVPVPPNPNAHQSIDHGQWQIPFQPLFEALSKVQNITPGKIAVQSPVWLAGHFGYRFEVLNITFRAL